MESSSDSEDEDEVEKQPPSSRFESEPPAAAVQIQDSSETNNSVQRVDPINNEYAMNNELVNYSPELVDAVDQHQPFRGRERSPSPNLPSVMSAPALLTGNGFSTNSDFMPEPRAIPGVPLIPHHYPHVEHFVKVEDVKNNLVAVVNGRRTSRDISPAPPVHVTPAPVKTEQQPGVEPALSKEELRRVFIRNQNMRHLIFKEVKRPGKDHGKLFEMLRDLHGPPSVRRTYIRDVIIEARRFKRETLVDKLEQAMDDLIQVL